MLRDSYLQKAGATMEIAILHLSDIHIKSKYDLVLSRVDKIRNAFHSAAPNATACAILISGDITYSGKQAQYEAATFFFEQLKAELLKLPHLETVRLVSVPGNHDCDLDSESDVREFLLRDIKALYESGIELNSDKARTLLSVQDGFFQFEAAVGGYKELAVQTRIAWGRLLDFGNFHLKFQCFNTAWLSRRQELQSKLFMPPKALEPYPGDANVSISVFHHPYNWLDASNYRHLKDLVERTSDFVFTGHEHQATAVTIERFSGEHLNYVEGAALQGDEGELDSAFNVVVLDFNTGKQRLELFQWNGEFYTSKNSCDWGAIIKNPGRDRHLLRVNRSFLQALNDTGTAFTHPRSRLLTLDDIFIYPRMNCWSSSAVLNPGKKATPVTSKGALDHFRESRYVLISGPDDSGKTSLLKKLYLDLSNEFVPIYLDASRLDGRISQQRVVNLIRTLVGEQYDTASIERYLQMEPSRKLLLIDDFHKANLSRKNEAKLMRLAEGMFEQIVVTVSDFYRIKEMVRVGTHEDPFREYERCDLKEFGHALRATLIRKWLSIGRNTAVEIESLDHEAAVAEKIVTSLLGKNLVPSYPFSVLTLLQMMESNQAHSTAGTSFGHLYETLIKASLSFATSDGVQGAEAKFNYIAMVAYRMFDQGSPTLTERELREVRDEYTDRFQVSLDFLQTVSALRTTGVLDVLDGNYGFHYKHFYYYFVAKYFDRALRRNDERSKLLRQKLLYISDRLHNEEYANVVLFYVHLSQDWELITHILSNANRVYAERRPCDFDEDVQFVNRLYKESAKQLKVDTSDIEKNREEYLARIDDSEDDAQPVVSLDAKVAYADDLADIHKVNIAFKTLQVLGQVLRSAAGSLEGDQKTEIIRTCYMLGLRSLNAILNISQVNLEDLRYYLASLITERAALEDNQITENQILKRTDEAVIGLTVRCAFGTLKKISFAVGSQRLEETYDLIHSESRDSMSM
jgi:predicted phosphodiesterase